MAVAARCPAEMTFMLPMRMRGSRRERFSLPIQVSSSLGFMPSPEREVVDSAREVVGLADRGDQLEVADALPDGDVQPASVSQADEGLAVPQARRLASVSRSESRVKSIRLRRGESAGGGSIHEGLDEGVAAPEENGIYRRLAALQMLDAPVSG